MPIYPDKLYSNPAQVQAMKMIRNERRARGLDFSELAAALGVSVRDYLEKETGRTNFTRDERVKLTAILGLSFDENLQARL